jgi:hypothetical protein
MDMPSSYWRTLIGEAYWTTLTNPAVRRSLMIAASVSEARMNEPIAWIGLCGVPSQSRPTGPKASAIQSPTGPAVNRCGG